MTTNARLVRAAAGILAGEWQTAADCSELTVYQTMCAALEALTLCRLGIVRLEGEPNLVLNPAQLALAREELNRCGPSAVRSWNAALRGTTLT
jgi:hypothetical protein